MRRLASVLWAFFDEVANFVLPPVHVVVPPEPPEPPGPFIPPAGAIELDCVLCQAEELWGLGPGSEGVEGCLGLEVEVEGAWGQTEGVEGQWALETGVEGTLTTDEGVEGQWATASDVAGCLLAEEEVQGQVGPVAFVDGVLWAQETLLVTLEADGELLDQ